MSHDHDAIFREVFTRTFAGLVVAYHSRQLHHEDGLPSLVTMALDAAEEAEQAVYAPVDERLPGQSWHDLDSDVLPGSDRVFWFMQRGDVGWHFLPVSMPMTNTRSACRRLAFTDRTVYAEGGKPTAASPICSDCLEAFRSSR